MIAPGAKLYSVIYQKCPRCHQGNMFEHPVFSMNFMKMHKNCPHCDLDFIQEPSFYFGAMYFSYAIQVAVFVMVYLVLYYTINPGTWAYIFSLIAILILILPLNYRWSRASWINLFIAYEGNTKGKNV